MSIKKGVWVFLCVFCVFVFSRAEAETGYTFRQWGQETLAQIETDFRLTGSSTRNLYAESLTQRFSAYAWPQGVMFGALAAASKVDPSYLETVSSMADAFQSRYRCYAQGYWAYNASAGNCGDRYYDDNAWIAIVYMELHELTGSTEYLNRAREILVFCMSGENGPGNTYDGGIRWHESNTDGVSICATAPTILANLMAYQATGIEHYLTDGSRLYHWLEAASFLRTSSGVYHEINQGPLGYLTAVVIQSAVRLYRITADKAYLSEAQRLAAAMEAQFINTTTYALGQTGKWGGHDMTNAYVDLYEADGNPYWLDIAAGYLTFLHRNCKDPASGRYPESWNNTSGNASASLIDNASVARAFWKMAGTVGGETPRYGFIRNRISGRSLRLQSSSTTDNTPLILYDENASSSSQMWARVDLGNGYYQLRSRAAGKTVQPLANQSANNTPAVIAQTDAFHYPQQWRLIDVGNGYFNIQNRLTGKSLQPLNNRTANNTAVILTETNLAQQSQHWQFVGYAVPTPIKTYLSINNGDWIQTARAILEIGDTVTLKAQTDGPDTGGTWTWIAPNGATANGLQEVTRSDFQSDWAGRYFVCYTNSNGATSRAAVEITVPTAVKIFQHCDYRGWRASFGIGAYTLADLIAAGGRNNDASSVKIVPGYTVTFYDNDNFQGPSLVKTAEEVCFVSDGWNDRITSFIVEGSERPVAHWPFNERSGTVAADASGNQRHAYLFNAADNIRTTGKHCGGLRLNGVDSYLRVPGFTGISGGQSRTCTAWVKTTATEQNLVLSWGRPQPGQKWMFGTVNGQFGAGVWGGNITTERTINDGQWHHVALVIPDSTAAAIDDIQLYVDGRFETEVNINPNIPINTAAADDVLIGARIDPADATYYGGFLDEVRIYDRPLSATHIGKMYADNALSADIVPDGVVDMLDFIRLAETWQAADAGAADLDCDGHVDLADFAVLAEEWLGRL